MNSPLNYYKLISKALSAATNIVVFTGARISAESGLSTFRDPLTGALWDKFDPEKLSTTAGFNANPILVWEWHDMLKEKIKTALPNAAHIWFAKLQQRFPVTVITQNVDDLHERAGSTKVIHLHGNTQTICTICQWEGDEPNRQQKLPTCPQCGSIARPNCVWFGESLPFTAVKQAIISLDACDFCFVVGTSGQVYPAAAMPERVARQGFPVVSINTRNEDHCQFTNACLTGKAGIELAKLTY